ncbi:MAG: DUF91 domain-containing protein [Halobacteriaceae archaeon]
MQDAIRVFAGECTIASDGSTVREKRGTVLTVVKPDNTALVHDAEGYQPTAWLTRAETVRVGRNGEGFRIEAARDGTRLTVEGHEAYGHAHYPVSPAGPPVGSCPDCGGALVRTQSAVVCTGCLSRYALPDGATVLEAQCSGCGLPWMAVDRGVHVECCIDEGHEALAAMAAEVRDEP